MDKGLVDQVLAAAASVVAGGAIAANGHGNVSLRVPGADANHGVLVFHRTPELAVLIGGVVEEAARAAISAIALGGPVEIAADMRAAALQRAMALDALGTRTA